LSAPAPFRIAGGRAVPGRRRGVAERARIELRAAGGHARQQITETPDTLTAQEALIARLACEGASPPAPPPAAR